MSKNIINELIRPKREDQKKILPLLSIASFQIKINGKNKHPIVKFAENHKVKLQNEIELYFEQKPKSINIGITGTNGKSTLASLLSHILSENKIKMLNIITVGSDRRIKNFSLTVKIFLFFIKLIINKKPVVGSNKKSCANIELRMWKISKWNELLFP